MLACLQLEIPKLTSGPSWTQSRWGQPCRENWLWLPHRNEGQSREAQDWEVAHQTDSGNGIRYFLWKLAEVNNNCYRYLLVFWDFSRLLHWINCLLLASEDGSNERFLYVFSIPWQAEWIYIYLIKCLWGIYNLLSMCYVPVHLVFVAIIE